MIPRFHRAVCDYFTLKAAPNLGLIRKPSESFRMTAWGQLGWQIGSISRVPPA
jgi:hypothetical protein